MKKRIFAKITAFVLLMTMLFSINVFADGYNYGYYVDNVEYIGDGEVEATIVFASNTYGSDVDVKGVGVLAVYDETQTQILGLSSIQYNETSPFLSNQRFSVTQTVSLTDLTLERYIVKFILLESMEDMKPAAYVSTGTNAWVLEGDEITDVPGDNPPSSGGSGGGGYLPDEDSTDLVIDPELFEDFTLQAGSIITYNPNIRYYIDADAETPNTSSKVEAPFVAYKNMNAVYTSAAGDDESDVAEALNCLIGSGVVNKVTTNNKAYRFKDTNNNGKYDKLVIENSASFVVGKIVGKDIYRDTSAAIFNSNLLFHGSTNYKFAPLHLGTEDEKVSYSIRDVDGKELAFEDIKVGDILTVAQSNDNDIYYYDIVVSTAKAVTGTIMRCSTKKIKGGATIDYYEINGKAYRINGAASASKLMPGVSGTFYLTNDNAIISCDITKNYSYGIVIAVGAKTGTFSNGVQAQIMSLDGEVKVFDFAETVSIFNNYGYYGDVNSKVDADGSTAGFQPNAAFYIAAGTIVIYETNSAGEIKKIYTTQAAIEEKENGDVKLTSLHSSSYDADSGKLDGKYITDKTVIIGVPSASSVANKDRYTLTSKNALADNETYNGTIIYDSATKDVKLAFITNLLIKPAYNSSPMVVTEIATVWFEEELRSEYTGLINGKEVRYVLENSDDITVIGMTGEVVSGTNTKAQVAAFNIGVNDVIQVVTNANNEIIAYRHIMKYDYNEGYIAMVATSGNEDSDTTQTATLKVLSTGATSTHNAAVTNKQMYGYAVSGRVNKVTSRGIEIFKSVDTSAFNTVAMLTAQSNIVDAAYNPNTPVYVYGNTYSKVKTTVFESIKTFDVVCSGLDYNVAMDMAKADDVVYIYSFDGENVLNFIVDVNNDNR